ncbi:uncharacterized protein LOC110244453 [Exaiptasia diaphana]|uniref:Uncharacterized protein n=1 Tax=Exaiptasia diaphana TaxID=2652724 RepID=A0A913XKM2_EXADI|nr:uncharacterized protein LOC110244453 [Exaiptasia diaphana]
MYRVFFCTAAIVLCMVALSMGKTIEKGGAQARSASRRQLGGILPPSSCSSNYECDYPKICHPEFGICYSAMQDPSLKKRHGGMLPPTSCSSDYECDGYQEICHPKYGFCYRE